MTSLPTSALLKQTVLAEYPQVEYGRGVYLYDDQGHQYLDGASGAMTASIGHGVAEVADAIRAQAATVAFTYRTQFTNAPAERLAARIAAHAPDDLDYAFFVNSGSEATEYAIRTAVGYWRERGLPAKTKVLSRAVSYHGMTMGALSMSGHDARRPDYGNLLHPFPVAPPAHAWRYAEAGETEAGYCSRTIAEFEAAVRAEDLDTIAAVIVEPIVGAAGGALVPPAGYLSALREMCDRLGILMIADEVITGFGRTGDWFACGSDDVVPDVLVFGKGVSGGYAAVAGALLRRHVVEAFAAGSGVAPFGHTFSGNPLGAATCLAVLDVLERDAVLENVRRRGRQLEAGLRQLAQAHPRMADVRGRGLLWGFEFTAEAGTTRAPDPARQTATAFTELCSRHGLIVYPAGIAPLNNAILITPPLTITESEIADLLDRLGRALEQMESAW
ncbi:aspartate aminotransferase family protein [Microbacterium thalassium]|uniref:Adenosylmethionine-8-amino-7-oxononanoate aminotransferase n=1 Tax=Microbacterium thalassium TaxID=362649 RepID=A0A7X0FM08_9MICO|nr:aminotransferase class III-fold pyridoxal phosphate-dependent enzyme [Microbacterium thalassium]MBB6389968.1 adenosylmethionine-8-amino-7-oxononanoate aminotransferase [Microbacterium thalassium]GLK24654.1 aspartate aminotransferase family protein [Microbacterium thalassium]